MDGEERLKIFRLRGEGEIRGLGYHKRSAIHLVGYHQQTADDANLINVPSRPSWHILFRFSFSLII